jgi:hypothetical protein
LPGRPIPRFASLIPVRRLGLVLLGFAVLAAGTWAWLRFSAVVIDRGAYCGTVDRHSELPGYTTVPLGAACREALDQRVRNIWLTGATAVTCLLVGIVLLAIEVARRPSRDEVRVV